MTLVVTKLDLENLPWLETSRSSKKYESNEGAFAGSTKQCKLLVRYL